VGAEQAQVVVCVSKLVESFVREVAPLASTVMIHNGVEIERFCPGGSPVPRSGLHVLTLRRLVPRNGVHVLVEAWRRAGLGPRSQLTIAGSGPEQNRLRGLARDAPSIRFLGHVPDKLVPDLYRTADLFVVPSVSGEGYGLVAAEALATGVPVVATSGGATGEVVRHGADGFIVPARDAGALAAVIKRFERDPALLARMAGAARQRAPELSWQHAVHRLAQTLETTIAGPVPPRAALEAIEA
jgi:glycosyltransferase involved in cell wall biosynthesis